MEYTKGVNPHIESRKTKLSIMNVSEEDLIRGFK